MFCPKCGALLVPKKESGKKVLGCSCGYKNRDSDAGTLKEVVAKKSKIVEVVEEEQEVYPLVDAECPECSHKKAYFWTVQTRAGDEPETKFYKCQKCRHTWRDYN